MVGSLEATAAMVAVGSSVAAATALVSYPIAGGQALRYGLAGALLVALARERLPLLTGGQTVRLLALAGIGLAGFNAFLIAAVRDADAGSVGVIVGCVPIALALAGPLLERRGVRKRVVAMAIVGERGGGGPSVFGCPWRSPHEMVLRVLSNSRLDPTLGFASGGSIAGS